MKNRRILNTQTFTLRSFILATLCGFAALLVPNLAQADSLRTDLDGDGLHDRVEVGRGSRELVIRSSATRRWQRLQTRGLIVNFTVIDLDRDGDPDLVANVGQSRLRIWINKGHGFFTGRTHHLGSRRTRLTFHRPRPAVRGVQTMRLDDSVNDSSRLLIVWSAPVRTRLAPVGETPLLADASLPKFTYPRRAPRGPPSRLVS